MELDIKDKKILHELELNARQSNSIIAKKVGISKDSVGYRIKQLESNGVIRGYRAIIDVNKLGYTLYRIYFRFIDISQDEQSKIIEYLKKEKNAWWISKQDGSWDFTFAFWTKSNKEFYEFYNRFLVKFRQHIKEKLICPIIKYHEFPRGYLGNSKINTIKDEEIKEMPKVDQIDLKLLRELSKNSRIQLIDLAHKFNLDNMTIFHRIKKLEQSNVIIRYTADINDSILERDFYTVEIDLKDFSEFKEIRNEILRINETTGVTESIGGYDIEFDLKLKSSQRYYEIIDSLKKKFPQIREVRYFRIIENYKLIDMPEE
jgi:Lrp/AsnC family transcriptional regulator, leucine-responsive regulatory protein